MSWPTTITFVAYLIFLLGIGWYFYRKSLNIEDYLLGGRSMGAWVTALSAQASDMSGWLLMALPGAVYLTGLKEAWIAIGLFIGTMLNWLLVSGRLRIYTQLTRSITLPCFFEARFQDPTGLLRLVSALVILVFFTVYASSGLVASGKLFQSTFNLPYSRAVVIGGSIVIAYTFLGGFMAVCWTDLFQGLLMIFALLIVPLVALRSIGGPSAMIDSIQAKGMSLSLIPTEASTGERIAAVISAMAWGLGYFGQPHILARFMSARSLVKLRQSAWIAMIWVAVSLTGAVVIGLIAIAMFDGYAHGDQEKVFIDMIGRVIHPWLAGVMLAAILSAIMSTIDSQLLVSSSALTEDLTQKLVTREFSSRQLVWIGRLGVIIISGIAMILALHPQDTILGIVAYAWGGFGAAFGPLILFALFSPRTTWQSALLGMIVGTLVLVLWKHSAWGHWMYELLPGFLANCLTMLIANIVIRPDNPQVMRDFKTMQQRLHETTCR